MIASSTRPLPAAARERSGLAMQRASEIRPPLPVTAFNLTRRFAVLSLLVITVISLGSSVVLSRFLTKTMLQRDAQVTMQFVLASRLQRNADEYFLNHRERTKTVTETEHYFSRLITMPDVLRAQVYDAAGAVLWSSTPSAIDHTFASNPELDRSLAGELVVEAEIREARQYIKPEHVFAAVPQKQFVEYYIPVWDAAHAKVIGSVELYKSPEALFATIRSGLQLIWLCALCGGMLMYGVLFWVVRRGQQVIRQQQTRIASNEGFAAVGEIAAAVAHNIRNPLAAIRSSAELMASDSHGTSSGSEFGRDIMAEVDRLESWIRSLIDYAHAGTRAPGRVDTNALLRGFIGPMEEEFARRGVTVSLHLDQAVPPVIVDVLMLEQIIRTLVGNASDAMPMGGVICISSRAAAGAGHIEISVADTGVGMSAAQLKSAFVAPRSTKTHGLGMGLPLVGRTLERMGGGISVRSTFGRGTTVAITLPLTVAGTQS
jgi:signal transduction histidine kinase